MSAIVGGILGVVLGGPIGGVVGAALGAALERSRRASSEVPRDDSMQREEAAQAARDAAAAALETACAVPAELEGVARKAAAVWNTAPLSSCQILQLLQLAEEQPIEAPAAISTWSRTFQHNAERRARLQMQIERHAGEGGASESEVEREARERLALDIERAEWGKNIDLHWSKEWQEKINALGAGDFHLGTGEGSLFGDPLGWWNTVGKKVAMVVGAVAAIAATAGAASIVVGGHVVGTSLTFSQVAAMALKVGGSAYALARAGSLTGAPPPTPKRTLNDFPWED